MIQTELVTGNDRRKLATEFGHGDGQTLLAQPYGSLRGTFDSTLLALAGTSTIVEAFGNQGIVLTDLVISAEKKNTATVTVFFDDGTNTESIMLVTLTDAPVNMAVPFVGHWAAWQGASLKVTLSLDAVGCVAVGYFRTPEDETIPYDAWIAQR
jgi:hypothetical protein